MASVKVRNVEIGDGIPKICVPIVDKTEMEILETAKRIAETKADLVEWRVDWFEDIFDFDKVKSVLGKLREILGEYPILFTCRTSNEGGEILLTDEQYAVLNQQAIKSGKIDLVDVEVFAHTDTVDKLIISAHNNGVLVIGSNHDFYKTPMKEEIVRRLCTIQEKRVDIAKIAVMPQNTEDVLTLLSATEEMVRLHAATPVITISMGGKGMISRVAGTVFGSAVTFASMDKQSAPGQMDVGELKRMMEILRS